MSKCQKNKYAAGGKCGSMGSDHGSSKNPEVNTSFAALLASRERQDALLFKSEVPKAPVPKAPVPKASVPEAPVPKASVPKNHAIIIKKVISKSDIDTVLEGDF